MAAEMAGAIVELDSHILALDLLSIRGKWAAAEQSSCISFPVFGVGNGKTNEGSLVGDGMNEPHMSANKPGALQTRCSFVPTKAGLAALSTSHVHSWILNAL